MMVVSSLRHSLLRVCLIPIFAAHSFHSTVSFPYQWRHGFEHQLTLTPINSVKNPNEASSSPRSASSLRHIRKNTAKRKQPGVKLKNPNELETWRMFGIDVDPDALGMSDNTRYAAATNSTLLTPDRSYLTPPVLASLLSRLRIKFASSGSSINGTNIISLPPQLKDARVVRRSIDARRRKGAQPKYAYVIDLTLTREASRELKLSHQPGKMERLSDQKDGITAKEIISTNHGIETRTKQKIIIVGAGPAGLFCALSLASSGLFTPIVLERGKPVESRGKSIGALIHRRSIDPESNFSFGEGGAGNTTVFIDICYFFTITLISTFVTGLVILSCF